MNEARRAQVGGVALSVPVQDQTSGGDGLGAHTCHSISPQARSAGHPSAWATRPSAVLVVRVLQAGLARRMMAAVSELSLYQVGGGVLAAGRWVFRVGGDRVIKSQGGPPRHSCHPPRHPLNARPQALSLRYAADRDALAAALAAARQNVEAGRPPTAGADQVGWRARAGGRGRPARCQPTTSIPSARRF